MKTADVSTPTQTPGESHKAVTDAVLEDLASPENRAVIVDSPPGAGK